MTPTPKFYGVSSILQKGEEEKDKKKKKKQKRKDYS